MSRIVRSEYADVSSFSVLGLFSFDYLANREGGLRLKYEVGIRLGARRRRTGK
jgi:hypothetical protein